MAKTDTLVAFRIASRDREKIRAAAAERGATMSAFIRKAAIEQAERDANRDRLVTAARELLATEPAEV